MVPFLSAVSCGGDHACGVLARDGVVRAQLLATVVSGSAPDLAVQACGAGAGDVLVAPVVRESRPLVAAHAVSGLSMTPDAATRTMLSTSEPRELRIAAAQWLMEHLRVGGDPPPKDRV